MDHTPNDQKNENNHACNLPLVIAPRNPKQIGFPDARGAFQTHGNRPGSAFNIGK